MRRNLAAFAAEGFHQSVFVKLDSLGERFKVTAISVYRNQFPRARGEMLLNRVCGR
jgi:hypothetical protein